MSWASKSQSSTKKVSEDMYLTDLLARYRAGEAAAIKEMAQWQKFFDRLTPREREIVDQKIMRATEKHRARKAAQAAASSAAEGDCL
jgi:hypothetical protein